jgi:mono/diheme cytochrome c family protein
MPAWKSQYTEEQRWQLVHYIRVNFTQTEARPVMSKIAPGYPDIYLNATLPDTASFERGKLTYLTTCAQCHGLSGQGDGWDGAYLDIKPNNLTAPEMKGKTDGDLFIALTYGVPNTAHPVLGEFLPEDQRWDVIKFVKDAFIQGLTPITSLYANGATAANVLSLSPLVTS